jgi:hypothetical protein
MPPSNPSRLPAMPRGVAKSDGLHKMQACFRAGLTAAGGRGGQDVDRMTGFAVRRHRQPSRISSACRGSRRRRVGASSVFRGGSKFRTGRSVDSPDEPTPLRLAKGSSDAQRLLLLRHGCSVYWYARGNRLLAQTPTPPSRRRRGFVRREGQCPGWRGCSWSVPRCLRDADSGASYVTYRGIV